MDVPKTIELKVGEVQLLKLQSLGTAGYVWDCTVEGNVAAIEVTVGRANQPQQLDGSMAFGSSLDEAVTILGREPGQAILHLVQRRPWETNQLPLEDYRIAVIVQP